MKTNLSRRLLASVGALAVTLSLPAIQSLDPDHFSASAFARDGSDDGGGSDSRGDDGSGSGRGDDNDDDGGRGDDNSGRGGHDDSDDDDDDHGGRGGHDDDGRDDDDDDDSGDRHGGRGDDNRPEVTLSVSEESLTGLLDGSLAAVDQLGRRLEVEIELEHGTRTVVAHPHRGDFTRNPGGITAVNIVSAAAR
ncbi:MAG: hypothetical protein H2046_08505 [Rhizobiales bacterium]|nr:hypothetical protein [Hyphomicrobiales bacterium]